MLPFEDSRRLTGANVYFDVAGAALETLGVGVDASVLAAWQANIMRARAALHWSELALAARPHASGASLAFAAPVDQLYCATEVNEWALAAALESQAAGEVAWELLHAPGHPASNDECSALHTLAALAAAERKPALIALLQAARAHQVSTLADDEVVSIGSGRGSHSWPIESLPTADDVPWASLGDIPIALVTGSNGKTTTVRLIAAMARAHGWRSGHSCTDGLFIGDRVLDSGDYSGPAGARSVLRETDIDVAVLETARGGMLRRGIAVERADVAVVTNVSVDHFGEYGIHSLEDLARVKLSVARTLGDSRPLVLNADNDLLVRAAEDLVCPIRWFALDNEHPVLRAQRTLDGVTCGVHEGHLLLQHGSRRHDLGRVVDMPLSFDGSATYNIANAAAASLAGDALGIPANTIASVLSEFGNERGDNPGRLQHWVFGGLQVFVDYAHNPDGLRGLLRVATRDRSDGRFGLLLGQAGNREDVDVRKLATVAAEFAPSLVLLKDIDGYMRGRDQAEIAVILRDALQQAGVDSAAIRECLDEALAARQLLEWGRDGDLLVLPLHGVVARDETVALLTRLRDARWQPGEPLAD